MSDITNPYGEQTDTAFVCVGTPDRIDDNIEGYSTHYVQFKNFKTAVDYCIKHLNGIHGIESCYADYDFDHDLDTEEGIGVGDEMTVIIPRNVILEEGDIAALKKEAL
jgi:hypothetical protein